MKIAIISDTHGNFATLNQFLKWLAKEKITMILHCGDVGGKEILSALCYHFHGQIHVALGNIDIDLENPGVKKIWREVGKVTVDQKKIAFTHFPEKALELAQKNTYSLIFYGHTHKPWERKIGKTRLVNPGTLAGIFYKATFAVYDTKNDRLELKILERL